MRRATSARAFLPALLLALCLGASSGMPSSADEGTPTLEQSAAAAVIKAHADGDTALIARIATTTDDPAPHVVLELLCAEDVAVARAFAAAAPPPARGRLEAYLAKRIKAAASPADLAAMVHAQRAWRADDWETLAALDVPQDEGVAGTVVRLRRAEALAALGRHVEATDAWREGALLAHENHWLTQARFGLLASARSARAASDVVRMLRAYEALEQVERASGNAPRTAQATLFRGRALTELGRYTEALEVLADARTMFAAIPEPRGEARVVNAIATVHRQRGAFARALVLVEEALAKQPVPLRELELRMSLGLVHSALGDHDKAVPAFGRAVEIAKEHVRESRFGAYVGNLGMAHLRAGQYEKAEARLLEARALHRKHENAAGVATALTNLGYLALREGKPTEALHQCEAARAPARASEQPFLQASVEQNVGECLQALGRHPEAIEVFAANVKRADELDARALVIEGQLGLAVSHLGRGDARNALAAGRAGIAQLDRLVRGLAEGQDARARSQHALLFKVAAEAAAVLGDAPALAEVLEAGRAMALLDAFRGRSAMRLVAVPEALREDERVARRAVGAARAGHRRALRRPSLATRRRARSELEAAEGRLDDVVGRMQRTAKDRLRSALAYPVVDDLETLQSRVLPGETHVLYGETRTMLVSVVFDGKAARVVPIGRLGELLPTIGITHDLLRDESPKVQEGIDRLRTRLIDPVRTKTTKRLVVSPVGALFHVPFTALATDLPIVLTPSATTLGALRAREDAAGHGIVALGGVDYSKAVGLPDLPSSADEARAIDARALLGADAHEANLRTVLGGRWGRKADQPAQRLRAVHVACHGLFDREHPLRSSLALTPRAPDDGRLTVGEVHRLDVQADLIVLSACDSGRGHVVAAEGLVGLPRAFLTSGARAVVASLWKVDDEATGALMKAFYRHLAPKDGTPTDAATALQKAQADVRATKGWEHPRYWAAWVVWGAPR